MEGAKRARILVAKLGLDGHDRGVLVLCKAFREAGMEVIYTGLFATPARVAQIAEDEDVDAVAMSLLNNAHMTLFPMVVEELRRKGMEDVVILGGGTIPEEDKKALEKQGVIGNFVSGAPLQEIVRFTESAIAAKRKC
ncbi:MAG: cobalamin B12-binding domain-containing protein [Candidatus Micrarchaeota archaeon]|nr:cobalamin B12-binding domain-containing protein [Candidatus Micrarchaeota archaeon]